MKFDATHEIIGWAGNLIYALFNIIGSAGIIYASSYKKDYQPVVLNFIWIAIAVFLMIKVII